jgi:hypothetical protein
MTHEHAVIVAWLGLTEPTTPTGKRLWDNVPPCDYIVEKRGTSLLGLALAPDGVVGLVRVANAALGDEG